MTDKPSASGARRMQLLAEELEARCQERQAVQSVRREQINSRIDEILREYIAANPDDREAQKLLELLPPELAKTVDKGHA